MKFDASNFLCKWGFADGNIFRTIGYDEFEKEDFEKIKPLIDELSKK